MTREEAMSYIIPAIERTWNDKICKQIKDVLSKQPSEWERDHEILKAYADGQESMKPCDDAISRQAVIRTIYDRKSDFKNDFAQGFFADRIRDLSPVRPQEKTGHWNCGDDMFEYAICSSCKHETGEAWEYAKRNFKYCPNCGAKMRK